MEFSQPMSKWVRHGFSTILRIKFNTSTNWANLFLSAIDCPWLGVGLPLRCPKAVWCQWVKIEPFSPTLAHGMLVERDQPGKHALKHSTLAQNWTQSEIHSFSHWAIITQALERTDSEIHSFSHWAIMTLALERTDREIHSFSHWAIITRATERTDSEIHSFYHWATMTRVVERTDREIDSFSRWAIMTRATERTGRETHSFSHWTIMTNLALEPL